MTYNQILNGVVGVSFDCSSRKCGYISLDGIGCTIGLLTGWPINCEILSNFGFNCKASEYKVAEWEKKHTLDCPQNSDGTAGAMELAYA